MLRSLFAVAGLMGLAGMAMGQSALPADVELAFAAQMKLNALTDRDIKRDGQIGPATQAAIEEVAQEYGFDPTYEAFLHHFATRAIHERRNDIPQAAVDAVQEEVASQLLDPSSAKFRNIYLMESGMICGEVNAKNPYGGYAGFTPFIADIIPPIFGGDFFVHASFTIADSRCLIDAR